MDTISSRRAPGGLDQLTTETCAALHALPADATRNERANALSPDAMRRHLATIVAEPSGEERCDLSTFSVNRPCYLADLQRATPDVQREVTFGGVGASTEAGPYSPPGINGVAFVDEDTYMFTEQVGTVVEYKVRGLFGHAYHQHVNPFQLQDDYRLIDYNHSNFGNYFQAGDWHDTLILPPACPEPGIEVATGATALAANQVWRPIRSSVATFTGHQVVHCHFLDHEDWGMMSVIDIQGEEGTVPSADRALDPTCYLAGEPASAPALLGAGTCTPVPCDHTRDTCGTGRRCECPTAASRKLLFASTPNMRDDCVCRSM